MKTRGKVLLVVLFGVLLAVVLLLIRFPYIAPWYHRTYSAEAYSEAVLNIESISETETETCILSRFEKLYPFWLGTRWNFNGISETPGEGKIACGYFVTTVVRDMHFDIPRIRLAQCASEEMIKTLVDSTLISRYSGNQNEVMLNAIEAKGRNLYIVGLDSHTGFLLNDGSESWFIHSSGRFPFCVVKEKASKSDVLLESQYKVVGCLSESQLIWGY